MEDIAFIKSVSYTLRQIRKEKGHSYKHTERATGISRYDLQQFEQSNFTYLDNLYTTCKNCHVDFIDFLKLIGIQEVNNHVTTKDIRIIQSICNAFDITLIDFFSLVEQNKEQFDRSSQVQKIPNEKRFEWHFSNGIIVAEKPHIKGFIVSHNGEYLGITTPKDGYTKEQYKRNLDSGYDPISCEWVDDNDETYSLPKED